MQAQLANSPSQVDGFRLEISRLAPPQVAYFTARLGHVALMSPYGTATYAQSAEIGHARFFELSRPQVRIPDTTCSVTVDSAR